MSAIEFHQDKDLMRVSDEYRFRGKPSGLPCSGSEYEIGEVNLICAAEGRSDQVERTPRSVKGCLAELKIQWWGEL